MVPLVEGMESRPGAVIQGVLQRSRRDSMAVKWLRDPRGCATPGQGFSLALAELLRVMPDQALTAAWAQEGEAPHPEVLEMLEKASELQSGLRARGLLRGDFDILDSFEDMTRFTSTSAVSSISKTFLDGFSRPTSRKNGCSRSASFTVPSCRRFVRIEALNSGL